MIRKKIMKLLISTVILIPLLFISCNNSSKKITISDDTQNEVALEESEVLTAITDGEKLIDEGKFEEAKEEFIKAINLDKTNKDIYLRIKDKYLSVDKTDEAYYFIKTAVTNNVDVENMKSVLKDISNKFEVIKLSNSIYQNDNYSLPKEITINISDTPLSIPITWDSELIDTSNLGAFTYEGYNDEYGRKVILELTVIENLYDKEAGSIKKVYSTNGKNYIDVDLVELYVGFEDAVAEAKKDNAAAYNKETGEYFLPNSYYIRNNYNKLTTYEVSNNCLIQLLSRDFSTLGYDMEYTAGLSPLNPVSFNEFKEYIIESNRIFLEQNAKNEIKTATDRTTLFWIEMKNGVANSIYRQHTP